MFAYAGEWRRSCGFCEAFEDSDADFHHLSRAMFDKKGAELKNVLQGERLQKYQLSTCSLLLSLVRLNSCLAYNI